MRLLDSTRRPADLSSHSSLHPVLGARRPVHRRSATIPGLREDAAYFTTEVTEAPRTSSAMADSLRDAGKFLRDIILFFAALAGLLAIFALAMHGI